MNTFGIYVHFNLSKNKTRLLISLIPQRRHFAEKRHWLPTNSTTLSPKNPSIPICFLLSSYFSLLRTFSSIPSFLKNDKDSSSLTREKFSPVYTKKIPITVPGVSAYHKRESKKPEFTNLSEDDRYFVKALALNVKKGSPKETLDLLCELLQKPMKIEFLCALASALNSLPFNHLDARTEWDDCVSIMLNKFIELETVKPMLNSETGPCDFSIMTYGYLARCISIRRLKNLVSRMEALGPKFNFPHDKFNVHQSLIKMYIFTLEFKKAIDYFDSILPKVDITMLGSVSNAYVALGNPDAVLKLMELGKDLGLIKDTKENFTLNRNVIDAAVARGGSDEALLYLKERFLDLPPPMLGEILSRILYWGNLEGTFTNAPWIFDLAKSKQCTLSPVGIASMMSCYINSKSYEKALEIFHQCETPSDWMYALALEAASKVSPSLVTKLHQSAMNAHQQGSLKLTGSYFYSLMKFVYGIQGYSGVKNVLQDMVSLGILINSRIQIQMLLWKHSSSILEDPLRALSTHLLPFRNERITYFLLIKGLLDEHRVAEAVDVLRYLLLEKVTFPDASILSMYVNYFGQRKSPELVQILTALIKSLNVPVEKEPVYLSTLLKAYSHIGEFAKAFEIWDQYLSRQKTPPLNMISSVIDACGFAQDLNRLDEIIKLVVEKKYGVDINVWTSAIEAYLRLNHLQGVKEVFAKWIPISGMEIDDKCLGTLLSMTKNTHLDEELKQVVRQYFQKHPDTTIKQWYSLDFLDS